MKRKIKKYGTPILMILFFLGLSCVFYFWSPENLIAFIGADNAYVLMLILSFLGGLSTFAGVPYHLVLITLASGGINPILLGLVTSAGVTIGDSTSYLIGYEGGTIIPEKMKKFLNMIFDYGNKYPKALPIFFFLYGALLPFSNDFIVISSGLARYPYLKMMVPLALGNVVFNIGLALIAKYSYGFLQGWLI